MVVDYSLYLVTDSTKAILGERHLPSIVKAAIEGGVTIVQYRDKTNDTAELIRTAKELHSITKAYNVPLLINDRVDVAMYVMPSYQIILHNIYLHQTFIRMPIASGGYWTIIRQDL